MGVQPRTDAVEVHSDQAGEFAAAYRDYDDDPYRSCFTYSRMRLQQALDRYLTQNGSGWQALDVGCGTGHHLADLAAHGWKAAGVDGSGEMLAEARRTNPTVELLQADVGSLPFADGRFDLALCVEVLRYLPDPSDCIAEMARVLRPGGVCLATAAPLLSLNGYAVVNRLAVMAPIGELVRLRQFFTTPGMLRQRFQDAGFEQVEVHGVYTGPINWVEHLQPRRLESFLQRWERIDRQLADRSALRGFSNMLLVKAVRPL